MPAGLADLIAAHGYWVVAVVIALESMGIPLPGETTLVTAAIFAGSTHQLSIVWVIFAAATGAIVGDNLGFAIGRRFGIGYCETTGSCYESPRAGSGSDSFCSTGTAARSCSSDALSPSCERLRRSSPARTV